MIRDLRRLAESVGPRVLVAAVVGCAVLGAIVGAVSEVVHQHRLPHSPKGNPPS